MAKTATKKAAPEPTRIKDRPGKTVPAIPPKGAKCMEADVRSTLHYMACNKPASFVVRQTDGMVLTMCPGCADHNTRNRGSKLVVHGEKYELAKIEQATPKQIAENLEYLRDRGEPTGEEQSKGVQPSNVAPLKGEEIKLVKYVQEGMAKFKDRLVRDLDLMVKPDRPASELAQIFIALRIISDTIKDAIEPLGVKIDTLPEQSAISKLGSDIIPKALEREKIGSFTTKNYPLGDKRVGVSERYFVSIIDKPGAFAWLRSPEVNLPDLIQETVNSQTLSSALRHRLETEGKEPPAKLFNAHFKPSTSVTAVQTKK